MNEPFIPTTIPAILDWIHKAQQVNAERDEIDLSAGRQTPIEMGVVVALRTAIGALIASYQERSWAIVGEALALVIEAEQVAREKQ